MSAVRFRIERESEHVSNSTHGSGSSGSTLASINYGTIFTALQDVAQERYFPYLPDHLISDAIKDAHELVEAFITKSDSEENEVSTSVPLVLHPLSFNGNKYLVDQGKFVRSNPIAENSLRLIMHETDDSKFYVLSFPHRYIMWKWFYVLRMFLRIWREECSIDDINSNQATTDNSTGSSANSTNLRVSGVSISMNGLSPDLGLGAKLTKGAVAGGLPIESATVTIDAAKAFKISMDGGRSIDLLNLKAIVLSADCYPETGISLQFGFDRFELSDSASTEKKRPSLTGSLQIGTMVSSVAQLAEEATLGTAKRAKNVVQNTANILATTIGASKRTEENGSSFFTSRQRDFFLLKYLNGNQFVEAKKNDGGGDLDWFQLDCFVPTSKMMANVIRFPFERCDALLFLYKAGIPQPVAAKVLEYEEIENWSKLSRDQLPARELDRVTRLMNDFNNPLREVCSTVNINMGANIDLSITILRADGILTSSKAGPSAVSVAAKCRMVNAGRHMLDDTGSPFVGSYDANSGVVEWDSASWRHKLQDHVEELQYVRVELIFVDNAAAAGGGNGGRLPSMPTILNSHDNSLGAIFIPVSSFTHHAKELVFPVDDFRQKNNLRRTAEVSVPPTVTVLIQLLGRQASKMSDSSNNLSSLIAPKAQQQMMREASVVYVDSAKVSSSVTAQIYPPYDVWYHADSILAGEVASSGSVPVEKVYVRFGRRALLLETNQELASMPSEWAALKLQQPVLYQYLWRKALLAQHPQSMLRVCEEAHAKSSRVFIDYSQIEKFEVISPGLMCITVTIHRYFPGHATAGAKEKDKDPASEQLSAATNSRFVPASLDLYVFNVRSKHIATLLDDRRHFASIRRNFLSIVLGNQYEDEDSRASDAVVLSIEMDHMAETCNADIHRILDNVTDDDIAQMITSGMGGGSDGRRGGTEKHLYDHSSSKVGEEYDPAAATIPMNPFHSASEKRHLPMQVWTEVRKVGSRECRLRMYEAALYGIGLQGAHDFNPVEVQALLQADIAESQAMLVASGGVDAGSHSSMGLSSLNSSGKQLAEEDAAERFASACQFLVAMAEKRIRETAIAGWSRRGEGKELDQCLVMLVEGYFNAILTTMRPLFVKEHFDQIKGLQVKLRYITFVLQHPDQWKTFLASALRPYRLHVSPEPRISSYIHPERLIAWYHEAIHKDMVVRVRHIFQVWQEQALNNSVNSTAAGSQSDKNALYTCNVVPWIPQRDQPDGGAFFSGIPEDCISILLIYLQNAVLKSEDIHEKYAVLVGNAQREVLRMYIDMFLAVQQGYEAALAGDSLDGGSPSTTTAAGGSGGASKTPSSTAPSAPTTAASAANNANKTLSGAAATGSAPSARHVVLQSEEMAAEYATWICSVANDCHRMRSRQMVTKDVPNFLQPLLQSDKGTKAALRRVHARLEDTVHHAMEQLSSIIFHVIFQERGQWSNYDQIIQSIVAASTANNGNGSTSTAAAPNGSGGDAFLSDAEYVPLAKDIRHCIEDFSSFLHPVCVIEYLLPICEDRLAAFLLSWLRAMRNRGLVLHHEENHALEAAIALEIEALLHFREKLLHFLGYSDRSSMLSTLIGYCRTLLLADIHAPEMIVTLKTVLRHAKTQPADANALLRWLKVAWSLRGFRKYFTASATVAKAVQHVKENASNVAATTTGSLGSVVTGSASVAVAAASAVVQLGVNASAAGSNAIRSRSADHGQSNSSAAAANGSDSTALDERHSFDPSSLPSSSSASATRPRFWRPFAALWARGGKAREVNEEGSTKDTAAATASRTPSDERSLPVGASSHSASFWQKLVASDESSAVGALTSSESGRFTAEMATLREQMQLEWIDQLMSDIQRIAEDYDARRPASTAGKISPLAGVTDAPPAAKAPTPEPQPQQPTPSLTSKRSSRFARWRRRRPLLRVYDRLFTKSPPPLPPSSSDPRELLQQPTSMDSALDDHDDRSSTATFRSGEGDDPTDNDDEIDAEPVDALSSHGPSSDPMSDAQSLQDFIPLLRWCFDSKQFDFRVSAIFQLHACKSRRFDDADASTTAANAAGVAGGAVMQLGQGGRILLTGFGHVVVGGVNTAVTLVNKSSSLLAATTTSSSPSAAPTMRRPWLSLFRRSQSTKRVGAGPWSTSSSTKTAETFGSPDKFRDAAVSQLSLAEQLNLLDIDGPNAAVMSPVSPRSPFTPQVHYQVRISHIRVVGTLRFVLFAQPKFALQFRVGTQVFVTRPSPMLTHFPTSATVAAAGSPVNSSENWYDFGEEEAVFVWTGKAAASSSMATSSLTTSTHPTVHVALLDTGVLVDQTLANVAIPLPVPETENTDAVGGSADAAVKVVSAQQLRPFTSFSSALRVQRAVKVAKQGSSAADASALPQLACSITIVRLR